MIPHRGHNELDNPTLTQPVMYQVIGSRSTVPDAYAKKLEVRASLALDSVTLSPFGGFE